MPIGFTIRRVEKPITSTALTIGTTAVQVSGLNYNAQNVSVALPNFTYPQSEYRQAIQFTNNGATTIYLGYANTVSDLGQFCFYQLGAALAYELDCSGAFVIWAISSASGGSLQVTELQ